MALFDFIIGKANDAISGLANSSHQDAVDQIARLIGGSGNAGLQGLLKQFQSKGMGDAVASWVGTGANLPITGEQLKSALGDEKVLAIAKQLGLSQEAATNALASLLPEVVNHLTPNGQLPTDELLQQGLAMLKSLGNRA
jgi:uncharacterized protein YidB (DUF937 family)